MYNPLVQQLLDSIFGYGGDQQSAQRKGPFSMLKQNVFDNAYAQGSGGILGRPNTTVPTPTAQPQTAPTPATNQTGGDLNNFINQLLSGGGGGGSVSKPKPPTGSTQGGNISTGGSGTISKPTGSTQGGSLTTKMLDREGGLNSGNLSMSPTDVMPGGGLISYGTTPKKQTPSYWWQQEPWY
jgi:hypothetical protein